MTDEYKDFEELCKEMKIDFQDDVYNKEHMDSGNLYAFYSEVIRKQNKKVTDVLDNGLSDDWFNSEIWEDDLDDNEVIENMLKGIEEERQNDPNYKDMFKKASDFGGLLHDTTNRMTSPMLDTCQILKDKFGIDRIDNETYMFLLSLPLLEHLVQKRIEELEGSSCCVDKTYILLSKLLKKKLNIK